MVYEVGPDAIEITVEDDGTGVRARGAAGRIRSPTRTRPRAGMGLAIIRAVMDELSVDGKSGAAGTVVHLRKRLSA